MQINLNGDFRARNLTDSLDKLYFVSYFSTFPCCLYARVKTF